MSLYLSHLPQVVVVFLALGLLIALSNQFTIRRFDQYPRAARFPRVSVLIPARNEAVNIELCVRSLLEQDYPDYDVLVIDDDSTDETGRILRRLAQEASNNAKGPRLRVVDGRPLPDGWIGKHWACHQLAQAAAGELLLFTDADTRHAPNSLRDSVSALAAEGADLITAFPREEAVTLGEKVIVPVISFGILSFLPIALARRLNLPGLSVTIGQFMLFRRSAYETIGGYEAVRDQIVDDVVLGRRIIQHGLRWRLLDGTRHVSCRMYRGFWNAVDGFTKNAFAFFDCRLSLFLLVFSWVAIAFLGPPFVLVTRALNLHVETYPYAPALAASGEAVLLWSMAYRRFGFPIYLALLYPLSFALFLLVAIRSLVYTLLGQATWKERGLARPAWRW